MNTMKSIQGVIMKEKKENEIMRLSSGSDLLDLVVGGGEGYGYPVQKIINIVGDKSSGKTFLACEILAATRYKLKEELKWKFDNCESGFTFDTQFLYGFEILPLDRKKQTRSKTVEDLYSNCRMFFESLKPGEFGIYVVDSLDGLTSKELQKRGDDRHNSFKKGKDFKDGSYQMGKAKFLSQEFFPPIADLIEESNGFLIIISQTRDKVDSMFKAQSRAGGRAMDFYCHTVLWLNSYYKIKKKGRAVGVIVKAHAKKSKTPRPFRECSFSLLFDYGLDNIGSNLDFLFDLRGEDLNLLKKSQSIVWEGGSENISIKSLRLFAEEIGVIEEFKNKFSRSTLKGDDKKQVQAEWFEKNYKDQFVKKFGISRTRDELIEYIESEGLQKELTLRVREKWEMIEQEIKTNRKKKY